MKPMKENIGLAILLIGTVAISGALCVALFNSVQMSAKIADALMKGLK